MKSGKRYHDMHLLSEYNATSAYGEILKKKAALAMTGNTDANVKVLKSKHHSVL